MRQNMHPTLLKGCIQINYLSHNLLVRSKQNQNNMKTTVTVFILIMALSFTLSAQTIWNGPTTTFSKADGADWTLEANQDRLTDNVWLTRANSKGLFNIAQETSASKVTGAESPAGTLWAEGTTSNIDGLTFNTLENAIGGSVKNAVGRDLVLFLVDDNIYLDLKFTSWSSGKAGGQGGFSYERSTAGSTSVNATLNKGLSVYPNPVSDRLFIDLDAGINAMQIKSLDGKTIKEINVLTEGYIDVSDLSSGIYFITAKGFGTTRFVKK
ncbi:MAG TPA: hypothetical protein DDX98_11125 [Bacteroidales bacterium]|nr:hypothetical protein [Bacteroidales bacterium]